MNEITERELRESDNANDLAAYLYDTLREAVANFDEKNGYHLTTKEVHEACIFFICSVLSQTLVETGKIGNEDYSKDFICKFFDMCKEIYISNYTYIFSQLTK